MPKKKDFIKKAIKKPGAFTAQARAMGMTVDELIRRVKANPENFSLLTRRRANLASTLKRLSKRK
jgi:ribosomal protein L13E